MKSQAKVATKVYLNYSIVNGSENTLLLYLPKSYALLFSAIYFLSSLKHRKCFL